MSQPQNLDVAYVDAFREDIRHMAEQTDSRLQFCCEVATDPAEYYNFDTIDPSQLSMTVKTNKQETKTKWQDVNMIRRYAGLQTLDVSLPYEWDDLHKIIMNPKPAYMRSLVALSNRSKDAIIFDGILAPAAGKLNTSTTPKPFDPSMIIKAKKMNIATLIAAKALFVKNELTQAKATCIIDYESYKQLLQDDKMVNGDYIQDHPLTTGDISTRLGFNFVIYNDNAYTKSGFLGRQVIVTTEKSVGLHLPSPLILKVDELPAYSYMWQIYMALMAGAVRLDEQSAVVISLDASYPAYT